MQESPVPRRGRPPRLAAADVVRAGVAIADDLGLDALTMRAVADRLAVGPMSLYTYVADKDALVDAMLEAVAGEQDLPAGPSGDWRADLRRLAGEQRALLARHPWVIDVLSHRRPLGPNALAALEFSLGALEPTGLGPSERMEVFALLTGFVVNVARAERADAAADPARAIADARAMGEALATGRFPHLASALAEPATPVPVAHRFDALLERMLDGLVGRA